MNRSEMCHCSADDRLRRVLMVRRLHPAVTMQSLLQTFGAFGSITGCKVFTHKSGRSAGCASVEFSSHGAACSAFKELQGTQLHGKGVHLQWFDHSLSSSPSRTPGQHMEMAMSPIAADSMGHMAGRSNNHTTPPHQPATPHSKSGPTPHMAQSPFGMLAGASHNPYCNGAAVAAAAAAVAAAHQQQLVHEHQRQQQAAAAAGLFSSSGCQLPYPQQLAQQLHRQVSAPLSTGFNQMPPAALQIPCSPHPRASMSTLDELFSPGPASANLSAAMAAASLPMAGQDSTSNLVALHHLASMQQQQQQQQLACLALQLSAAGHSSSQQQDSPLSPVRALQHHQQQQQQAFALAAALHNQQQVQQQAQLLQHHLSGQLQSPAPAAQQGGHSQVAKLQLARSMPAALGSNLGGSCSPGNQGQLDSSSVCDLVQAAGLQLLQQQQQQNDQQNEFQRNISAPGSAGALPTVSPFALNQPGTPGVASDSGSDRAAAAGAADPAAAAAALGADAGNESAGGTEADTVPASVKRLRGNRGCEKYHAKKQLFRDEGGVNREISVSLLPTASNSRGCVSENGACPASSLSPFRGCMQHGSAGMLAAGGGSGAALCRASKTDDTAPSAADIDMLAAAALAGAAGASSGYPMSPGWAGNDQPMDVLTSELLASFNQSEPVPCSSPFMQNGSSATAAAASLQQQQLLAAGIGCQSQLLPPLPPALLHQQLHHQRMQFSLPLASVSDAGAAGTVDEMALRLANVRVKDARASDSQVLLGSSSQRFGMAPPVRLSSPSLPGTYGSPAAAAADTATAATAAQAWQQAMLTGSNQQQQQQLRSSCSNLGMAAGSIPASEAFKHKHKQQLQLELPEYDMVSAPLTSSHISGGCDGFDQLITTEVMPESPAVALHSPLDVHAAMMVAAGFPSANGIRNGGCSSDGGVGFGGSSWGDWSSMAALLSPVHVSSLACRRFTDFYTGADAAQSGTKAGCSMMGQQQQQQGRGAGGGWLGPRGSMGGVMGGSAGGCGPGLMPSLCEQQQGSGCSTGCAPALDASAAGHHTSTLSGPGSRGGVGMTRHSSLCLDAHPQLLPFQLGLHASASAGDNCSTGTNGASSSNTSACGGGSSSKELRASCPANGSSTPASMLLKRGLMSEGGPLHSSGSFTFQPPVLLQQQSRLACSGGSASDSMITEPFQMPAFFRESASSAPGTVHQAPPTGSPSHSAAGGAAAGASMPLPSVMECSQQQQEQGRCNEGQEAQLCSPVQRQLHHSFSMPASFGPQDGTKGLASPHRSQQQLTQKETAAGPEQEAPAGYGDVFRSLWGSNGGSSL